MKRLLEQSIHMKCQALISVKQKAMPSAVVLFSRLKIILVLFRDNKTWHVMWIVCSADDSHEMPCLVFFSSKKNKTKTKKKKKQKNNINVSYAVVVGVVPINYKYPFCRTRPIFLYCTTACVHYRVGYIYPYFANIGSWHRQQTGWFYLPR